VVCTDVMCDGTLLGQVAVTVAQYGFPSNHANVELAPKYGLASYLCDECRYSPGRREKAWPAAMAALNSR
jgi:hypothetical protein